MAAFPFPIPEAPQAEKTRVTFAFPPVSPYALTTKTRLPPVAPVADEKEPLFRVPAWIPVPVEGALYFVIGALIGTLLMLGIVNGLSPLRPAANEPATPRSVVAGVRQASIVGPQTAPQRAPIVAASEPSSVAPSLPLRTASRLPVAVPRPLRGR